MGGTSFSPHARTCPLVVDEVVEEVIVDEVVGEVIVDGVAVDGVVVRTSNTMWTAMAAPLPLPAGGEEGGGSINPRPGPVNSGLPAEGDRRGGRSSFIADR